MSKFKLDLDIYGVIGTILIVTGLAMGLSLALKPAQPSDARWEEFSRQVVSFKEAGQERGVKVDLSGLSIRFTEMFNESPILGVCSPSSKSILVNRQFWDGADSIEREFLIWHEMGHCVLGREHSTWIHNGMPVSIMYPMEWATNHEDYYFEHYQEIINELFAPFQGKFHEIDNRPAGEDYYFLDRHP